MKNSPTLANLSRLRLYAVVKRECLFRAFGPAGSPAPAYVPPGR